MQVERTTVLSKLQATYLGMMYAADAFTLPHHSHYSITSFNTNSTFDCRAIGAITVTVPTCWYLLQPDPNKGHGHGHEEGHGDHEGEEEHEEAHDSTEEEPAGKDEEAHDSTEDEPAEKADEATANMEKGESIGDEGNDAEASSDSDSNEDKGQETPDTSADDDDDEPKNFPHETDSGGDAEGVQFKGASKKVKEDDGQGDTRKHIPDAKGFNKKRIESKYGNRLGLDEEGDDKTKLTDKVRKLYDPGP